MRFSVVARAAFAEAFARQFPDGTSPYVDTHCHLDAILNRMNGNGPHTHSSAPQPADLSNDSNQWDLESLLRKRFRGGYDKCVTVCCEARTVRPVLELLDKDASGTVYAAFGIHPHRATQWVQDARLRRRLEQAMRHPRVVAWGECGLDYYRNLSPVEDQHDAFIAQMRMAQRHAKPLVVHGRDADEDLIRLMMRHLPQDWTIHLHCCTSGPATVERLLAHFDQLHVGFTGCITFPRAHDVRESVAVVPLDRLLLETDGPYMAPVPFRGMPAHPGMTPWIATAMAAIKDVSVEEMFEAARENTRRVYRI